jgi:hypothetical protein
MTNVIYGIPLSIWSDWRNLGPNETNFEYSYGIVENDYYAGENQV